MSRPSRALAAVSLAFVLAGAACASDDTASTTTTAPAAGDPSASSSGTASTVSGDCETVAATFREVTSANPDLVAPELTTSCADEVVEVTGNGIPDYVYLQTSPGSPIVQDLTFRIPVAPSEASTTSAVPLLGPIAVAVDGVPIYGPTEGSGGDVLSLAGALSECGSHNGPTGFHLHLFGWAAGVDCLYASDVVEAGGPLLVGWSVDGYPIMSGLVCVDDACTSTRQLQSSWELTDESLFATDTWAAHTYVAGSGDLDECNGRVDDDGEYRYYTTPTFPHVLGCYRGEVAADAMEGTAGGPGGGPPAP